VKPSSVEEVAEAVSDTKEVRTAGSGHSFSPLVATDDTLVSLEEFTGVVSVDEEAGKATARAGTVLSEFNDEAAEHGLAMENLGDVDRQTVSGAVSTGTHGTGQFGVIATQLSGVEVVTADGETRWFEEGDDAFGAAKVSLGALGVLTEMELDLVPSYGLELVREKQDLDESLSNFHRYVEQNRNFEFFWFPNTRTAITKRMNEAPAEKLRRPDGKFENAAWKLACEASRFLPSKYSSRLASSVIEEQSLVGPSHEVYPFPREVRFNETEYGVPAENFVEVFREIVEVVEDHDAVFPVEVRYVEGDEIPLSPAHGRDTVFIAVHRYHKKPYRDTFEACQEVFRDYGGRPHWGKMHFLSSEELRDMYPEWDAFQDVRQKLDPDGVFLNEHLREVFGV
jgi:L-gulonolactone oxidase